MAVRHFCDKCNEEIKSDIDGFRVFINRGVKPKDDKCVEMAPFEWTFCLRCMENMGFDFD